MSLSGILRARGSTVEKPDRLVTCLLAIHSAALILSVAEHWPMLVMSLVNFTPSSGARHQAEAPCSGLWGNVVQLQDEKDPTCSHIRLRRMWEQVERQVSCPQGAYQAALAGLLSKDLVREEGPAVTGVQNALMELRTICNQPLLSRLHVQVDAASTKGGLEGSDSGRTMLSCLAAYLA